MAKYIVFIKRDGFDFYSLETRVNMAFAFSPEAVQDLEVLDDVRVTADITNFIQTNQLVPGTCTYILSDAVVFTRDFVRQETAPDKASPNEPALEKPAIVQAEHEEKRLKDEMQEYLRAIPFEHVASKTIKMGNGYRIVAANKDFQDLITGIFSKQHFVIDAVVPLALLTGSLENQPSLTMDVLHIIEQSPDILHQHNLLSDETVKQTGSSTTAINNQQEKPSKTRQYILLGAFGILIIILFVMVYKNYIAPQPPVARPKALLPAAVVSPSITVVPTPVVTNAVSVSPQSIKVEIQSSTASPTQTALKTQLANQGYNDVLLTTSSQQTPGVVVVFDTKVPQGVDDQILSIVKSFYPQARSTQSSLQTSQVVITIGAL